MKNFFAIALLFVLVISETRSMSLKTKPTKSGKKGVFDIYDADGDGVQDNV